MSFDIVVSKSGTDDDGLATTELAAVVFSEMLLVS